MRLKGSTAIITGSTSGFGKAMAMLFTREGAEVAVVGRDMEGGERVVRTIKESGGDAAFFHTEMTDPSSVKRMVEDVVDLYGKIDILINNVGLVLTGSVLEISMKEWEDSWHSNVTSTYLACQHVIPYMQKRKSGTIVNMSSTAGVKGLKNRVAYCTAKTAVIGLTKALAVDHTAEGIRVNCICPGAVETEAIKEMMNSSSDPEKVKQMLLERRLTPYLGTVEEIAEATLFLASPENKYLTGTILSIDGGASIK